MKLAAKKSPGSITQSLQTLEGAACMNNTFCLGIFYILIWYQGLAWKFTAETIVIFFVQVLIFLMVIKSNTQTMKEAIIIFGCYPLSLVFVSFLESMGFD
jgi:Ca2+/Na+ antiporter